MQPKINKLNKKFCVQWHHINSLKSVMSWVFSIWNLANSTKQGSPHPPNASREPAHHCYVAKFNGQFSVLILPDIWTWQHSWSLSLFESTLFTQLPGDPTSQSASLIPSLFSDLLTVSDPGISVLNLFSSLPYLHSFFGGLVQFHVSKFHLCAEDFKMYIITSLDFSELQSCIPSCLYCISTWIFNRHLNLKWTSQFNWSPEIPSKTCLIYSFFPSLLMAASSL